LEVWLSGYIKPEYEIYSWFCSMDNGRKEPEVKNKAAEKAAREHAHSGQEGDVKKDGDSPNSGISSALLYEFASKDIARAGLESLRKPRGDREEKSLDLESGRAELLKSVFAAREKSSGDAVASAGSAGNPQTLDSRSLPAWKPEVSDMSAWQTVAGGVLVAGDRNADARATISSAASDSVQISAFSSGTTPAGSLALPEWKPLALSVGGTDLQGPLVSAILSPAGSTNQTSMEPGYAAPEWKPLTAEVGAAELQARLNSVVERAGTSDPPAAQTGNPLPEWRPLSATVGGAKLQNGLDAVLAQAGNSAAPVREPGYLLPEWKPLAYTLREPAVPSLQSAQISAYQPAVESGYTAPQWKPLSATVGGAELQNRMDAVVSRAGSSVRTPAEAVPVLPEWKPLSYTQPSGTLPYFANSEIYKPQAEKGYTEPQWRPLAAEAGGSTLQYRLDAVVARVGDTNRTAPEAAPVLPEWKPLAYTQPSGASLFSTNINTYKPVSEPGYTAPQWRPLSADAGGKVLQNRFESAVAQAGGTTRTPAEPGYTLPEWKPLSLTPRESTTVPLLYNPTIATYQPHVEPGYTAPAWKPLVASLPLAQQTVSSVLYARNESRPAAPADQPVHAALADATRMTPAAPGQESRRTANENNNTSLLKPVADTTPGALRAEAHAAPAKSVVAAAPDSASSHAPVQVEHSIRFREETVAQTGQRLVAGAAKLPADTGKLPAEVQKLPAGASRPLADPEKLQAETHKTEREKQAAGRQSGESGEHTVRYVAAAGQANAESAARARVQEAPASASMLARLATAITTAAPLDAASGKAGVPAVGRPEAAGTQSRSAEVLSGPVSLASLTAKYAGRGDGILAAPQSVLGRPQTGPEAAGLVAAAGAAQAARITGAASADAALANALIAGRGIFPSDLLAAGRAGIAEAAAGGRALAAGLQPLNAAWFGSGLPPGWTPGKAALSTTMSGITALETIRAAGVSSIVGGRTVRIDPVTGQVVAVLGAGRSNAHLNIAELQLIQKSLGEGRYLTCVEITVADSIASSVRGRRRGAGSGMSAAAESDSLEPDANAGIQQDESAASGQRNFFKRPTYMIAINDSLVEIAERLFKMPDLAWLIADINAASLTEHFENGKRIVELRSRQEIELPLPSEIREFLLCRSEEARAENLVTIVSLTQIDRELLNSLPAEPGKQRVESMPASASALEDSASLPLLQLVDFGMNISKTMLPSMNAIVNTGLNLKTYISKIDMVPPHSTGITVEHRRSLIEMVAHDLRSPLMSAQVSIDLVQEIFVELSDEGFDALQSAQKNLSVTIESARNLLNSARALDRSAETGLKGAGKGQLLSEGVAQEKSSEQVTDTMSLMVQELRIPMRQALESLVHFEHVEDDRLPDAARQHLRRAQSGVNRALGLISDQLRMEHFFKKAVCPDLEKSACDVSLVAADAVAALQSLAARKKIRLVNECVPEIVVADRHKLCQVVINFVSNAIKFSPENTSIRVTSKSVKNTLRVSVSDQGPGMDRHARKIVFERFSQVCTDQAGKGHGLGLSICKLIARAHGGRVGVTSDSGKGSTFWVEIPKGSL
jgi:signal transduction histidine kinase